MFMKPGTKLPQDEVFNKLGHVKKEPVRTMIGDLKNPKYCGPKGPVEITAEVEHFVRVH